MTLPFPSAVLPTGAIRDWVEDCAHDIDIAVADYMVALFETSDEMRLAILATHIRRNVASLEAVFYSVQEKRDRLSEAKGA